MSKLITWGFHDFNWSWCGAMRIRAYKIFSISWSRLAKIGGSLVWSLFDPIQDFWFDREEISSFMKSLNRETVILTNISKHKRRIVTHKKMKSGILKLYSVKESTDQKISRTWIPCSSDEFWIPKSHITKIKKRLIRFLLATILQILLRK